MRSGTATLLALWLVGRASPAASETCESRESTREEPASLLLARARHDFVEDVALSPDDRYLAVLARNGLAIWDTATKLPLWWIPTERAGRLRWTDERALLVEHPRDRTAVRVDLDTGRTAKAELGGRRERGTVALPEGAMLKALSSDRRLAAYLRSDRIGLFDLSTRAVRWERRQPGALDPPALVFDAAGTTLWSASRAAVERLDVALGRTVDRLPSALPAGRAEFLEDDRLVSWRYHGSVTHWDLTKGAPAVGPVPAALQIRRIEIDRGDLWTYQPAGRGCPRDRRGLYLHRWPRGLPPKGYDEALAAAKEAGSASGVICVDARELRAVAIAKRRALVKRDSGFAMVDLARGTSVELVDSSDREPSLLIAGRPLHLGYTDANEPEYLATIWEDDGSAAELPLPLDPETPVGLGTTVAASKDETRLAIAYGPRIFVFDLASKKQLLQVDIDARPTALAFAGGDLLVGDESGHLRRLGPDGRELARSKEPATGPVLGLVIAPSGARAASIDDDLIHVWNLATLRLSASFAMSDDGEWIAATPGGAIHGSHDSAELVGLGFTSPVASAPLGAHEAVVRRPDIVRRRLAGEGVDLQLRARRPPELSVERFAVGASAALELSVRSTAGRGEVVAYVEGREVKRAAYCGEAAKVTLDVPVPPGATRLTLFALDTGGLSSTPAMLDLPPQPRQERPDVHAVIVGIGRYPKLPRRWQLQAARDARALARAVRDMAGDGRMYRQAHVTLLVEGAATATAMKKALAGLSKMRPGDLAIVYLAGHGWRVGEEMVLLTSQVATARDARTLGISWGAIQKQLEASPGRVLVLLDACHAGWFNRDVVVPNDQLSDRLAARGRAGIVVFAASKGRQFSFEAGATRGFFELAASEEAVPVGNTAKKRAAAPEPAGEADDAPIGLYTTAIIAAFSDPSADTSRDGALQLSELVDWVSRQVSAESGDRQTPIVSRRELFGDFTVGPLLE